MCKFTQIILINKYEQFWIEDVILSLNCEKKVQRYCWSFTLNLKWIKP